MRGSSVWKQKIFIFPLNVLYYLQNHFQIISVRKERFYELFRCHKRKKKYPQIQRRSCHPRRRHAHHIGGCQTVKFSKNLPKLIHTPLCFAPHLPLSLYADARICRKASVRDIGRRTAALPSRISCSRQKHSDTAPAGAAAIHPWIAFKNYKKSCKLKVFLYLSLPSEQLMKHRQQEDILTLHG